MTKINKKSNNTESLSSQDTNSSGMSVNDHIRRITKLEEQIRLRRNGRSDLEFVNRIENRIDPTSNAILPNGTLFLSTKPYKVNNNHNPYSKKGKTQKSHNTKIRRNPFTLKRRKKLNKENINSSRRSGSISKRSKSRSVSLSSPKKQQSRKISSRKESKTKTKRKILGNLSNLQ
tara:strand:+ start:260 stop:784 length:525 start_codon:yes stop_codon:yes gene_type:complete